MSALFASGHIIDLILVLTAAEALFIVVHHRSTGRGPAPADVLINLLSGVCLMLALRGALTAAAWWWIALWLAASLMAHLWDLQRRHDIPRRAE